MLNLELGNPAQRCRLIKIHNKNFKSFLFYFNDEEVCEGGYKAGALAVDVGVLCKSDKSSVKKVYKQYER